MTDVRTQDAPATAAAASGPNPPGSFIWYELMTTDAEGAKDFYDEVVGWNIAPAHDSSGYRMIQRSDGGSAGGVLPLSQEMQQHGARSGWNGYLNVADIHDAVRAIEAAGGRILMGPHEIDHVGPIAMVTDPQGAPFYVMRPNPPKDQPGARSDVFSATAEQRVGWNELATSDADGAIDFYRSQFGWTKGDAMPMGEMGTYQLMEHDGTRFGAIMTKAADKPSRWRFYFRVPDVDRAKSTVESKGGTVVHGPMEVPGGDRVLIGTDPQGAEFALVGSA